MLEVGKSYPLADGSGAGTVVSSCFMVRIDRPGKRYNGEVQHYDAEGNYIGSMSWETPALLLGGAKQQGAKPEPVLAEGKAVKGGVNDQPMAPPPPAPKGQGGDQCPRFTPSCLKCNGCQWTPHKPRNYDKPFGTACHFCDQIEHPEEEGPVPGVGCRFCHLSHCSSCLQRLGGPGCVCMKQHPFGEHGDTVMTFEFSWAKGRDAAKPPAPKDKPIADSSGVPPEESVWQG